MYKSIVRSLRSFRLSSRSASQTGGDLQLATSGAGESFEVWLKAAPHSRFSTSTVVSSAGGSSERM